MSMSTIKNRINISASKPIFNALKQLARRDDVPVATKTLELVRFALESEEDFALGEIARGRDTETTKWVSHEVAWKISR